jgi:2-polyprenyl-6-methoxyphenol hydroxylase-like FAD-dependent oxidoreductase
VLTMSRIVIAGGGIVGLSLAMMLTKQGHEVTVLERDGGMPGSPDEAWQAWNRHGVAQFRQPHYLHAAGRQVLDEALPEVTQALRGAGAIAFDVLALMPPFITDRTPRDGDERFVTVTGRRPVIEYAVATAAQDLDVRRGVFVTDLVTGPEAATGVPNVTGVRTSDGEELAADLVIDAMGRRSGLPGWLAGLGARPLAEEAEDSGFAYYTRYFRSATGTPPQFITGLLTPFESFSLLTLPGDAGTWSVTVYISSRDQALKEVRHTEKWRAVVAACPLHAHLLDGEPVSEILAMSGVVDRHRRTVVNGTPVVTGLLTVGDSACCTNPSLGRGMTMGLMHAAGTAEVISNHLGDPVTLALQHDRMTQARVTPWYRNTVEFDRARKEQLDASVEGHRAPEPTDSAELFEREFGTAMLYDADIFRGMMEIISMYALPGEVFTRPGFVDAALAAAEGYEEFSPPGPSRADLLKTLA